MIMPCRIQSVTNFAIPNFFSPAWNNHQRSKCQQESNQTFHQTTTESKSHIKTARISNFFHDVYHFLKANSYKNPPHPLAPRDLGTMASMLEKWWFHSEMLGFMVSKWSNNAGFGELISIFPRQIAQRLPDVPLIFCASRFTMISGKRRAGHHFCRSRPWHGHFWGFAILVSKLRLANRWRRCKNGGLIWFIWLDMVNNG